ncbi:hypothetical protein G7046_g1033 [Stylonectria norvegica]|nr:hypothetical protein G7046_g1033 [Stylonectria norvegica]
MDEGAADPRRGTERRGFGTGGQDISPAVPPTRQKNFATTIDRMTLNSPPMNNRMSTTSTSSDMTKQQIEDLFRNFALDELKSKCVDEIFAKLKTELVDSSRTGQNTPSSEEAQSPRPAPIEPYRKPAYQATVEDVTDMAESFESKTNSSVSGGSPPSSVFSESSKASNMSSKPRPALTKHSALHTPFESPYPSPRPRPMSVRFSDRVPVILQNRPSPPQPRKAELDLSRQESSERQKSVALSAVDVKWGELFNDRGEPTARLGQFLRGIANYIISEYNPTNSIVITPEKLYAFYTQYKLDSEVFPFRSIFHCNRRGALDNLEDLYQHLRCGYHLVQGRSGSMPHIPALTPAGFQDWMVRQIQAFPEQEAKRLNRVLAELPISADGPGMDGKPERLPKQLSRHLLPETHQREVHTSVVTAISNWLKSAGYSDLSQRKEPRSDDGHRSGRRSVDQITPKDDVDSRHRPEDYKSDHSSKHRHRSRDRYSKSSDHESSRSESSGRHISRTNSEGYVKHSRHISPPPVGSHRKARSPVSSKHYRNSNPTLSGSSKSDDRPTFITKDYIVEDGHAHLIGSPGVSQSCPRTREQQYRFYQGREPRDLDSTPRSLGTGSKRGSMALSTPTQGDGAATYQDYMLSGPDMMRNVGFEEGGPYRAGHPSGAV